MPKTVAHLERGEDMRAQTIAALRAALESAGVIFVEEIGEGSAGPARRCQTRLV